MPFAKYEHAVITYSARDELKTPTVTVTNMYLYSGCGRKESTQLLYSTFGISQQDIIVVDDLRTKDVVHTGRD